MDSGDLLNIFGTSRIFTKSGPLDPVFITETLQKTQEQIPTHLKHIISVHLKILDFMFWLFSKLFGKRRAPKHDEDPYNIISKILDTGPISTRKRERNFGSMVPISI